MKFPPPLSRDQRILLMGGHRLWKHRTPGDSFTWDAWRALSPRYIWKCLISDVLTHVGAMNGGLTP